MHTAIILVHVHSSLPYSSAVLLLLFPLMSICSFNRHGDVLNPGRGWAIGGKVKRALSESSKARPPLMIFCRHSFYPGLIWHRSRGRGKIHALSIHTLSSLHQWSGPGDFQLPPSVFLLSLLSSCKSENILQRVKLGHNFLHIY